MIKYYSFKLLGQELFFKEDTNQQKVIRFCKTETPRAKRYHVVGIYEISWLTFQNRYVKFLGTWDKCEFIEITKEEFIKEITQYITSII